MCEIVIESIKSAILVSGLVIVMMMLIESLNIDSHGRFLGKLKESKGWQVIISALLGLTPGCVGGFASVSLYTHGIISFGALIAMMIASSGDEAFVMIAALPGQAWWIFVLLFAIAVAAGFVVNALHKGQQAKVICSNEFEIHHEDRSEHKEGRHYGWKRIVMFVGVAAFITALLTGWLGCTHDHASIQGHETHLCEHHHCTESHIHDACSASCETHSHHHEGKGLSINLLSEEWMYWLFGALSLIVLAVLIFGSDHFVEEHLWQHIIAKHLASIFMWTFGVLLALGVGLSYFNIETWINSNTALMIVLATLVGIIPESGPHLVFVTLYASGLVPLPVLLSSCISQDGHASLPLLAESKKDFFKAKVINCIVALIVGFACMWII